jgi:predicted nuclease of predicted toxin-antitoxin system
MRILIDEYLDWSLGRALTGHDCVSVQKMGWGGIKNGELLALAQEKFDVFLTADRNLSFQQNTTKFQIAVVVIEAGSTQLNRTLPLMPKVLALLPKLTPGQVETVSSNWRTDFRADCRRLGKQPVRPSTIKPSMSSWPASACCL